LDWVKNYKLDDSNGIYSGGIEDLGNYKEGYCFKLHLRNDALWAICG